MTDEDFEKELEAAFDVTEKPETPPAADDTKNPPQPATPPVATPNVEDIKDDQLSISTDKDKKDEEPITPPADPAEPPKDDATPPANPETPPEEEAPKPLTEEGVRRLLNEARTEERNSGVEIQNATKDVMDAYYPEGLSNVLVDQSTGKELRTPQDVVDAVRASGGEMSTEEAAQWILNEQYKLDTRISEIKKETQSIAETTVNFKRDSMAVLQKYEPLFKKFPQLQSKTFNLLMKQVKADETKGVILSAPDVFDLYDTYLEPYQQAYEFSTQQSATNPVAPPPTPPATPTQSDRLDEGGDGGANTEVDDPNDFAQQVNKELAKGI